MRTVLLLAIFMAPTISVAQSSPPRKDIPTIAKSAKASVVTIVLAIGDRPIAQGTGFLVSSEGVILTNYHVVARGNVAVVKFADGTILPVDGALAGDKLHDLALLKVHGKKFQALTLGNSDQLQVGEDVVAIGNPLGLELTVSNGIVSGIRTGDEKQEGRTFKLLQITAPISHGSSGGPLFNMTGEVVGINALFLEGGESLNFAVPINDAKSLLQNQSVLQHLPNEPEADTSESEPPKSDDGRRPEPVSSDSYYVRAYTNGIYVIEHGGLQLAAICRETLTWLDGTDKPGSPMAEHDCTYMPGQVGKNIRSEMMWEGDKELRFQPWVGQDTLQTADVLDITAEAPIGSRLFSSRLRKSSPTTSPEVLRALHWIQNTLADEEGRTLSKEEIVRESRLDDVNGCQVTFAFYERGPDDKVIFHSREHVNLGDLDPASLTVHDSVEDQHIDILGPISNVTVHTTDKEAAVRLTMGDWAWEGSTTLPSTDLLWQLPAPYAVRFAKALRQAITLCGGKRSSY